MGFDGNKLNRAIKIFFLLTFLVCLSFFSYAYDEWCYQEYADSSAECGNEAGNYALWDNNNYGLFYINYTKPEKSDSDSLWRLKMGQLGDVEYEIPLACWNQDILQFMIKSSSGSSVQGSRAYCYDGASWTQIVADIVGYYWTGCAGSQDNNSMMDGNWGTYSQYVDGCNDWQTNAGTGTPQLKARIFEEAMNWHIELFPYQEGDIPEATIDTFTRFVLSSMSLIPFIILLLLLLLIINKKNKR